PVGTLLQSETAVVTASFGMLAWLVTRLLSWRGARPRSRAAQSLAWARAVAVWTAAAVGVLLVVAARLYLGWSRPSAAVASVLLGALWDVIFIVAWRSRDRLLAAQSRRSELLVSASGR